MSKRDPFLLYCTPRTANYHLYDMDQHANIAALFEPRTVAVIGASSNPGKIGNMVAHNLVQAGYKGKIFPVNPKANEILGIKAVNSIDALPRPLDLAVICVPPGAVVEALQSLALLPVKAVIVITAGFKEAGRDGYYLEEDVKSVARENNIALLGPNCLGLINTANGLNASFAATTPAPGNIAFFSQSGALCVSILDWAAGHNIGFSSFISLGNKALINEADMLAYLLEDEQTKVILGYMESVEDGRAFIEAARNTTARKPVILIKSGATAAGAKAASSHTGAIAGSDQAYEAAFRQCGVIRVKDVSSLFNLAQAFSTQPLPKGPNLAIVTNSGGPGILAADAAERSGLLMATLSQATVEKMQEFLPAYASLYNPIDIIGDADAQRYKKTLQAVSKDERVSSIMTLLSPTASVEVTQTSLAVLDAFQSSNKPFFACYMGEKTVAPGKKMLQDAGVPCYDFPEPAIYAIDSMYAYYERTTRGEPRRVCVLRDLEAAKDVVARARQKGQTEIVEFQAQTILDAYNLPHPATQLARTSDEAVSAAEEIGYPVVLKIASPDISHKSDVGGVKVGLKNSSDVRAAFLEVTSRTQRMRKDALITGCLIQSMAPKGAKEVIVGFKRDPQFGPLVLFGLGGIYVEVLKDVSFRLAPLSMEDASTMIREIRSFPLLRGVRGEPPVDFDAIRDVLLAMSQLAMDFPQILEAECNPVLAHADGAVVADIRATLSPDDDDKTDESDDSPLADK